MIKGVKAVVKRTKASESPSAPRAKYIFGNLIHCTIKDMFLPELNSFKRKIEAPKATKLKSKAVFEAHLSPDKKVAIAPTNKIINKIDTSISDELLC